MKTGVYLCSCGSSLTERIDFERTAAELGRIPDVYVKSAEFLCAEDGKQWLEADLTAERPDRVVVAACSPREYEPAFRGVLERAGINPYFLQMANIREQVAWVTPDVDEATAKAAAQVRGAIARVGEHRPLEKIQVEASADAVVIGAGPAGLKCALALAEGGRKVVLVEQSPALGGLPARFEDVFPNLECSPCMLEPLLGEVLHGPHSGNIEILTLAEVVAVAGYYGNFAVSIRVAARHLDVEKCIGCGECIPPCPVGWPNEFDYGLSERKAIALPFLGALPNVPFLDEGRCLRWNGEDCTLCRDACPVEDTLRFDEAPRLEQRKAGAIVVAIGASLYDCGGMPELGWGVIPGVYNSLEFERLLASNGPGGGELRGPAGGPPSSVAIVHCVGSLDEQRQPYCSAVCCRYALKFDRLIEKKLPGAHVHHFYRQLVVPGKEGAALLAAGQENPRAGFTRYDRGSGLRVARAGETAAVEFTDAFGEAQSVGADLVVLCPAVTGPEDGARLGRILDAPSDRFGFFEELHGIMDAVQSTTRGIYLAGACQGPMDIQQSAARGMAAAGHILSGLAPGRKLDVEPITASVDESRCSLCRTCGLVCPYHAIWYPAEAASARVNAVLCHGCGTCVAACPAGAIVGNHFTNEQILAELEAVLQ